MRILIAWACLMIVPQFLDAERRVAMIVDTSGSMNQNDRPRYATQIAKTLSDLAADDDRLIVIRMPTNSEGLEASGGGPLAELARRAGLGGFRERCSGGPEPRLGVALRGSDRPAFKTKIDELLHNGQGTFFAQPIHTARVFLGENPSNSRLMLFLADSGGFETNCAGELTDELREIRRGGTYVGLINLGVDAGTFTGSPAFDTTAAAPNSEQLVSAVAGIYQRFLGSQKTQTGVVHGPVTVRIDPYVKEAFLVVASDGPLAPLTPGAGSPAAEAIDNDYRGGASTQGLDGTVRGYRILRLKNPAAGSWTFNGPDLRNGGWMLLEDYAVALRSISAEQSTAGEPARLQFELFDERTGKRIADPRAVPDMAVQLSLDGAKVAVRNNGDGTFSAEHRFPKPGQYTVQARLTGGAIDRSLPVKVEVVDGGWKISPQTPPQAVVNSPVSLRVKVEPTGPNRVTPPKKIVAEIGSGEKVDLLPVGGDSYEGAWTPRRPGTENLHLAAAEGEHTAPATASVEVAAAVAPPAPGPASRGVVPVEPAAPPLAPAPSTFHFSAPSGINLGVMRPRDTKQGRLTLVGNDVPTEMDIQIRSDLNSKGLSLEIQTASGWQKLGSRPVTQRVAAGSTIAWPMRVRTASCPAVCRATDPHEIELSAALAGGVTSRARIPVTIEVLPDPWLQCNWPLLAAAAGLLVMAAIAYGFYAPYRFPGKLGIQLSPEIDLSEGFFYPLRKQPGAGSGFYRHARLFVAGDFRISGKSNNAFARLRADRKGALIQPAGGQSLWRQTMDGEWDRMPEQETAARTGTVYRNDDSSVFFELRLK